MPPPLLVVGYQRIFQGIRVNESSFSSSIAYAEVDINPFSAGLDALAVGHRMPASMEATFSNVTGSLRIARLYGNHSDSVAGSLTASVWSSVLNTVAYALLFEVSPSAACVRDIWTGGGFN